MTTQELKALLDERFGGRLTAGYHNGSDGQCCALELLSVYHDYDWTDSPSKVRCFDLRHLNDIHVDDAIRTEHLLPVLAAYDGSLDWPIERQVAVVSRIAIGIVREIVSGLPGLSDALRDECRTASDLHAAREAAEAAAIHAAVYVAREAAREAKHAAEWAEERAAEWAAERAAAAAREAATTEAESEDGGAEKIFRTACRIFLDALD